MYVLSLHVKLQCRIGDCKCRYVGIYKQCKIHIPDQKKLVHLVMKDNKRKTVNIQKKEKDSKRRTNNIGERVKKGQKKRAQNI